MPTKALALTIQPDDEREPWDQLPGEADTEYRGFAIYRAQGPTRKSKKAWEAYNQEAQQPLAWEAWCVAKSQNKWDDRAKAWDRQCEREARKADMQKQIDMINRHARHAQLMATIGAAGLQRIAEKAKEDPSVLDKLNPQTLATFISEGLRLERIARMGTAEKPTETKPSFTIVINAPAQPNISILPGTTGTAEADSIESNLLGQGHNEDVIEGEVRELEDMTNTTSDISSSNDQQEIQDEQEEQGEQGEGQE